LYAERPGNRAGYLASVLLIEWRNRFARVEEGGNGDDSPLPTLFRRRRHGPARDYL